MTSIDTNEMSTSVVTTDELRETFIDINFDILSELHEHIKIDNVVLGLMNNSECHQFIHILVDNIHLNVNDYDSSTDDDN